MIFANQLYQDLEDALLVHRRRRGPRPRCPCTGRDGSGPPSMWCRLLPNFKCDSKYYQTDLFRFALQQQIILNAIQTTGCPLTDIECICSNEEFVDELVEQIPLVCSAEEISSNLYLDASKSKMCVITQKFVLTIVPRKLPLKALLLSALRMAWR